MTYFYIYVFAARSPTRNLRYLKKIKIMTGLNLKLWPLIVAGVKALVVRRKTC